MLICCPICKELNESDGERWREIEVCDGWANSGGKDGERTERLNGLCEECATTAYLAAVNALRSLAGVDPVTKEEVCED